MKAPRNYLLQQWSNEKYNDYEHFWKKGADVTDENGKIHGELNAYSWTLSDPNLTTVWPMSPHPSLFVFFLAYKSERFFVINEILYNQWILQGV